MDRMTWAPIRRQYCDGMKVDVALEAHLVYPIDLLPDQPARVLGHRCSYGLDCNQRDQPSCCWAGSLPGYDPLA
jgi:hypothetical protein